jgi:DNA replication protein DnaC
MSARPSRNEPGQHSFQWKECPANDYRTARKLDRGLFQQLATGRWIEERRNLLITGPCGVGKTWLACALGQKACRDNRTVIYKRLPRLFAELELAHGDGRFPRLFSSLVKVDLVRLENSPPDCFLIILTLDDWGPDRLNPGQRRDLMEIVEDRSGARSTLVTSQLPVDAWHAVIDEPTVADAILDRVRAFLRTGGSHALTPRRLPPRPRRSLHAQAQGRRRTCADPVMTGSATLDARPSHQQAPPTRDAASAPKSARRAARGALLLMTGTACVALD